MMKLHDCLRKLEDIEIRAIHLFIIAMALICGMAWTMGQHILIIYPLTLALIIQIFDMKEASYDKEKTKK